MCPPRYSLEIAWESRFDQYDHLHGAAQPLVPRYRRSA